MILRFLSSFVCLFVGLSLPLPGAAHAQGSFGALEGPADAEGGARRAFIVGIDAYDDPALGALRFARHDAEGVAAVLRDPTRGGFTAVELVVEGDLTARGIVARLNAWAITVGPQDLAFIYFSGHGTRELDEKRRSRVFLATSDTKKSNPATSAVPLEALQSFLETLPTTRRVLVIDACFTGQGKIAAATAEAVASAASDESMPFSDKVAEKEAQLFATTFGRPALELDQLQHGVYTSFLIDALGAGAHAADINGDGVISVSEAHDYARDGAMQITGEVQIPMAFYKIVGNEELFLSGDPTARADARLALITSYSGPQEGMSMLVDGEAKGVFPRTVAIESGSHVIEFRNHKGRLIEKGRVTLVDGRTYDVSDIRKTLNGGRHLLSVGYAHSFVPGALWKTEKVPHGPGVQVGYALRFPGKSPAIRVFGLAADFTWGVLPGGADLTPGIPFTPTTHLFDLGVGPTLRVPLGVVTIQVRPRVSVMALARAVVAQPFVPWVLGTAGLDLSVAVHPAPRVGIKVHWIPAFTNAALDLSEAEIEEAVFATDGWTPPLRFLNRIVAGVEVGF